MLPEYNIYGIGDRIKSRRKSLKLSQQRLAEMLELKNRTSISHWEKEHKTPDLKTLITLCNVLDCDLDYLAGAISVPRRSDADVIKATGLSQAAVDSLKTYASSGSNGLKSTTYLELLSSLIANTGFFHLVRDINKSIETSIQNPYEGRPQTMRSINGTSSLTLTGDDIPEFFLQAATLKLANIINEYRQEALNHGKKTR